MYRLLSPADESSTCSGFWCFPEGFFKGWCLLGNGFATTCGCDAGWPIMERAMPHNAAAMRTALDRSVLARG